MAEQRPKSDELLVEEVRTNNPELYTELVHRYQNRLLRYANYLSGDQDSARDIVQEAFIKAYANLNKFDTQKKFSSWIYRIVHNQAMNTIKTKKAISIEQNDWVKNTIPNEIDLESDLTKEQTADLLDKSINALPAKYSAPLALFFLEDQPYETISDILKIPVGTVGTRINRGKKLLKTIYINKGGELL